MATMNMQMTVERRSCNMCHGRGRVANLLPVELVFIDDHTSALQSPITHEEVDCEFCDGDGWNLHDEQTGRPLPKFKVKNLNHRGVSLI